MKVSVMTGEPSKLRHQLTVPDEDSGDEIGYVIIELSSGNTIEIGEETGPLEEGNAIWVKCPSDKRLIVEPRDYDSLTLRTDW